MTRKTYQYGLLLILLLLLFIFLIYRYVLNKPKINDNNIKQITITALPSPPKIKAVTKEGDIQKFVEFLDSIRLTPTIHQTSKGWEYKIQIEGSTNHSIELVEKYICYDGIWYSIDDKVVEDMRKLYQSFDYPVKNVLTN